MGNSIQVFAALGGALAAVLIATPRVHAQGTRADYERSDALQRLTQGKVIHGAVKPTWIGDSGRFWYRDDLGNGRHAYILVDPAVPSKLPAFDAARMATALGAALKRDVSPDRLPIDRIDFTGVPAGTLRLQSGGYAFLCDLKTYVLTRDPAGLVHLPALPPNAAPRASVRTGDETVITFVNALTVPVDLVWRDPDGLEHPYGTLAPAAEREMHTFAGHVWLVRTHDGARPLAVFIGDDHAGTAVISAEAPAARRYDRTQPLRPRRRRGGNGMSPDGSWAAVIRDFNVVLRDSQGVETILTRDGTAVDAYTEPCVWSPDSKKLVVYKTVPAQEHKVYFVESSPKDQKQPKLHSIDYLKPGDRVALPQPHLFEIASKRDIPIAADLFPNPYDMSDPRWAADSSEFTFVYNQRGHQVLRIVGVDAATGHARAVVDETSKTFIDYSGKQFEEYLDATSEIVWMSERDGWNHLYLYDSKTGVVKNKITNGDWVVRNVDRVDPVARQIWFQRRRRLPRPGSLLRPVWPCQLRRHRPDLADAGGRYAPGRVFARQQIFCRHLLARRSAAGQRAAQNGHRRAGRAAGERPTTLPCSSPAGGRRSGSSRKDATASPISTA